MQIDASLVRRLLATQFPRWSHLPVAPVEDGGWDNRTFRLGATMSVRLPSAAGYAAQVAKEHRWLPGLAPQLPLVVPTPIAKGLPGHGYPWHWSVYSWIEGTNAASGRIDDLEQLAVALAEFLRALQQIDATRGPAAGPHNFHRGGPPATYDAETRDAIAALRPELDGDEVLAVWEAALLATWRGSPVWVHGDVSAGNLLVRDGRLVAVIDFGCLGVGDPACDLTIAWTLFEGASRQAFRSAMAADAGAWARARGWALWKALITLAARDDAHPAKPARRVIDDLLSAR